MAILVIDIGGSSVKMAVFEAQRLQASDKFASPSTWQEMQTLLTTKIDQYLVTYKIEALSFSVPGIPDQVTGEIKGASSLHYLHGFLFRDFFEKRYQMPVYFENDANCACLAEMTLGAARGINHAVFLVIGTGIGGVIVADGQVVTGAHNFAGEFGMMLIDERHEWSELGSAVHMARRFSKLKNKTYQGHEIFALAKSGDVDAVAACEQLYHYLALGIYQLQYVIDPQCFILSGGITANPDLLANIKRHLEMILHYGQRSPLVPQLVKAVFESDANLLGAGLMALKH